METIEIIFLVLFLALMCSYKVGCRRRRAVRNGKRGESKVKRSLVKYCNKRSGAHLMHNVTLCLRDGSTTQIDHILITTQGIFVLETKHYSGWIFANPTSKVWTNVIFKAKYRFQNPIFQNYRHVKAVQNLITFIKPQHVHNIVVFSGEAVFKNFKPSGVFYIEELIPALSQYSSSVLSLNCVQYCIERLENMRLEQTKKTDIEHQKYLSQRFGR